MAVIQHIPLNSTQIFSKIGLDSPHTHLAGNDETETKQKEPRGLPIENESKAKKKGEEDNFLKKRTGTLLNWTDRLHNNTIIPDGGARSEEWRQDTTK